MKGDGYIEKGIYKRGNIFWIHYYDGRGRQHRESSHSEKISVARQLLKSRQGDVAKGKRPGIHFEKVRWDELCKDFLDDQTLNMKKSAWRAEISANHLKDYFEGYRVMDITTTTINGYIKKRRDVDDAAPATINRELAALKRMFTLGKEHTPPKVNEEPKIHLLEENNIRMGFFEHSHFLTLRSRLPKHLYGPITIGYFYGFRKSEILGLTWDRIDMATGVLRLEPIDTKNKEPRTIYLNEECRAIIQAQWDSRKDLKAIIPYVFPNEDGEGIITDFRKSWATACKDVAELRGKLFHDLRRTAVRNMIRAGVPQKVAMMISGHKTASVFERYNIIDEGDLKDATLKITEHIKNQPGHILGTMADIRKAKKKARKTA